MDLLRKGRTRAEFERFAAIHADGLLRSAYLMSGDRGEAEDLVQEYLLRLASRWPRVRSMEHPGAYARRVLFNLALDGGRKRTRRGESCRQLRRRTALAARARPRRRWRHTLSSWFLAWWPGTQAAVAVAQPAVAAEVTTPAGTSLRPLTGTAAMAARRARTHTLWSIER